MTGEERFVDALRALDEERATDDALNTLVLSAGLSWREVEVLRTLRNHLLQIRTHYNAETVNGVLLRNSAVAGSIYRAFAARFDPARVPTIEPWNESNPFSSITWNTFSNTTMASSMTTPTISARASIVTLFSVNPNSFMNANVEISDAGIATAAISVERHDFMNSSTQMLARMLPVIKCPSISCSAARMYRD